MTKLTKKETAKLIRKAVKIFLKDHPKATEFTMTYGKKHNTVMIQWGKNKTWVL